MPRTAIATLPAVQLHAPSETLNDVALAIIVPVAVAAALPVVVHALLLALVLSPVAVAYLALKA